MNRRRVFVFLQPLECRRAEPVRASLENKALTNRNAFSDKLLVCSRSESGALLFPCLLLFKSPGICKCGPCPFLKRVAG